MSLGQQLAPHLPFLRRYGRALISSPLNTDHILEMLTTYAGQAVVPELAVVFLRDSTQRVFAVRYPTGGTYLEIVEVRFGLSDDLAQDRKSTRLNSSHMSESRMPSSA